MYSRQTGLSQNYSAEYLRAKYAQKTSNQRSPFKQSAPPPEPDETEAVSEALQEVRAEQSTPEESSGIMDFISKLQNDDLLLLGVLAFLLFSDSNKKNFDLILAAALLFIEFA